MKTITVKEAIEKIQAPQGLSSIIHGILTQDPSYFRESNANSSSLEEAKFHLAKYQKELQECKSDYAYWSILGHVSYWQAAVNIIEAGEMNNGLVADIEAPPKDGIVMDLIGKVENYGNLVFEETKKIVAGKAG